jgi:hypothetical protein
MKSNSIGDLSNLLYTHDIATVLDEFGAALKQQPGVWGQWPTPIKPQTARAYVSQIRKGQLRAFRGGEFRAAVRQDVLYVQYVGVDYFNIDTQDPK